MNLPLRTSEATQRLRHAVTAHAPATLASSFGVEDMVILDLIADWTEADVWAYARASDVPSPPLHQRGFPSIGCAPCTRAVMPGEDPRSGRWWWEAPASRECGIHIDAQGRVVRDRPATVST